MSESDATAALRTAADDLRKGMFRTAAVSLALLFLTAIAFSRAMQRINTDEIYNRLDQIHREADLSGVDLKLEGPNLSAVLAVAFSKIPTREMPVPPEQRATHIVAMEAEAKELERMVTPWFTIDVSIFGTELSFDLRYWMFLLPPFLWITNGYLWITRVKIRVLHRLGRHHLEAGNARRAAPLDRLYFSERAAYANQPASAATFLYVVMLAAVLVHISVSSAPLMTLLNEERWSALYLFSIITMYVGAFPYAYGRAIERAADGVIGTEGPRPLVERWVAVAACSGRWITERLARLPRLSISAGSVILLTSMFMILAIDCDGHKYAGYALLNPKVDVEWFTQQDVSALILGPGRVVYGFAVLLAAVSLLLCAVSLRVKRVIGVRPLTIASIFVAIFALFDLGFAIPLRHFVLWIEIARIVLMGSGFALCWLFALSKRDRRRMIWRERIWPVLLIAILPGILAAPVSLVLVALNGFWGAYPFYLGSALSVIGWYALFSVTVPAERTAAVILAAPGEAVG